MFSKEEAKALRLEFWQKLGNRTRRLPGQKGRKRLWIADNTGIKGLDLRFDVGREKIIVALEINIKNEEKRLALYEKLEAAKSLFEAQFGEPMIWDFAYVKDNGREVCRVYVEQPGDMYIKETWPEIHKFMIDRMIRLEKAFLEVKDYLKYS
ncbi:MAG: hypothetical protein PWQ17_602 [Anaerophaga sp.]|uniref:DUF4268 domain-containing protein n=1 Tax=Anaerophaga thermohalophila TaxID=177400 RepID=UPI000237D382|nr:DUF4268 domain-containing protein [Anaerophaga thermohalophila]MDI3521755.1 hypothetical protein [Anaerophaga sp.]MDK2841097.1 hypothetical protein [Anaerophaga sp.]MDN5290806.1 hypothetical protein [Anaerophaga sp.]